MLFTISKDQAQRWGVTQYEGRNARALTDGVFLANNDGSPCLDDVSPLAGPITSELILAANPSSTAPPPPTP